MAPQTPGEGPRGLALVVAARALATRAHAGQERVGGAPYLVHPVEVVAILRDHGIHDPDTLAAAWLHDVVEDTPCELPEIEGQFGPRVADIVDRLTKRPGQPKEDYYARVWADSSAATVKLADRLSNLWGLPEKGKGPARRYVAETREQFASLDLPPRLQTLHRSLLEQVVRVERWAGGSAGQEDTPA